MGFVLMKRYLPKSPSDVLAFTFLMLSIHMVGLFEIFYVLPGIYSNPEHSKNSFNLYWVHMTIGFYIYFCVMINLYKMVFTNTTTRGLMLPAVQRPGWRFCAVCECNAPPRSFHCHLCNVCILKRDHHCTFTGSCVGLTTTRYYIGMVMFMALAAGYSCVLNLDYFYHIAGNLSLKTIVSIVFPLMAWMFSTSVGDMSSFEVFMTSLTLIGFCLTSGLLVYHLINLCNGQTTFEKTYNIQDFNLGLKENLGLGLGTARLMALVCPLISSPIPSDGLSYVTRQEYESLKNL